jgi:hypothetical protein
VRKIFHPGFNGLWHNSFFAGTDGMFNAYEQAVIESFFEQPALLGEHKDGSR